MPNYCWLPFFFFSPLFPVNSHDQPLEGCTEDLWNETQCCHQVVAYYYYTNIYLTLCISFNWSQWTESLMCCLLEPHCVCRRVNLPRLLLWSCVLLIDALIIRTAACLHLISYWRRAVGGCDLQHGYYGAPIVKFLMLKITATFCHI